MEKKIVTVILQELDTSFFDKDATFIVKDLNFLVKKYKEQGFQSISVSSDYEYGELEGFSLLGYRLETDDEIAKRLEKSEKQKIANEKRKEKKNLGKLTKQEKEYQAYLELKEKFEQGE